METDSENELVAISKKLNAVLSVQLRMLFNDRDFSSKRKKGAGELAGYLAAFGLEVHDIAEIIGSPITSVRTLITPRRRKS